MAFLDQFRAQCLGIGEIAVVAEGHLPEAPVNQEWMRRARHVAARGAVARVADGRIPGQRIKGRLIENVRHMPLRFMEEKLSTLSGADARGLLAPVLKGVKS